MLSRVLLSNDSLQNQKIDMPKKVFELLISIILFLSIFKMFMIQKFTL